MYNAKRTVCCRVRIRLERSWCTRWAWWCCESVLPFRSRKTSQASTLDWRRWESDIWAYLQTRPKKLVCLTKKNQGIYWIDCWGERESEIIKKDLYLQIARYRKKSSIICFLRFRVVIKAQLIIVATKIKKKGGWWVVGGGYMKNFIYHRFTVDKV